MIVSPLKAVADIGRSRGAGLLCRARALELDAS
jgi:hypothetical protein